MNEPSPPAPEALLEAVPLPLLLFGPDLALRFVNSAFLGFSGIPAERLPRGLPLQDCARLLAYRGLLGPGDPARVARDAVAIDRSRPSRRLLHGLNGRIIEVHSAPTADGGFLAQAVDVTPLVAAQGEAARQAQRLGEVVSALATGIAAFGPDMRLGFSNPAYGALIGLPATQLPEGVAAADILRLLDARGELAALPPATVERLWKRAAGGGPPVMHRRRPTGQVVETRAAALSDGGMLLEVTDVTARQNAEDEARRRAALLDSILDALPTAVTVFDAGLRVTMVNRANRALLSAVDVSVGDRLEDIVRRHAKRGAFGDRPVEAVLAEDIAFRTGGPGERILRWSDGLVLSQRVAPLPDGGHVSVLTDITGLAAAEAEAQRQAARLSAMVERLPFGVALFDAGRRLIAVNGAALRLTGLDSAAAPLGTPMEEILARQMERGQISAADRARAEASDRARPFASRRTRPDGVVVDMQSLPMPDGGFLVTFQDVTPIISAEEAARAQAAMLRAMVDNAAQGVLLFDEAERLVAINETARRLDDFGPDFAPEGMTRAELMRHVARRGGFGGTGESVERVLAIPATTPRAYRRTRADGTVMDVAVRNMPGGGFVVSLTDVTPLVAAERTAQRRAEMLRGILDNMAVGVLLYDADDRLLACNGIGLDLTSIPRDAAVPGARCADLMRMMQDCGEFTDGMPLAERIAAATARRPLRYSRTRPDGTVLDVTSAPMPDGGFVITFADVTPLSRAEAEANRRAAQLQGMIDNASYGVVLYDAAHRFVAGNALALDYIGLDASVMRPGAALAEILAQQVARGGLTEAVRASLLAVDRTRPHAYRRIAAAGKVLEIESKPMPDGGFVVSFADVTTLVRAEEESRQRAAVLAAMLDNMRHGIALLDAEGRLIDANPLAARLAGLPPEAMRPGVTIFEMRQMQIGAGEFSLEEAERRSFDNLLRAPQRYVRTRPDGTVVEVTTDRTPEGLFVRTYTDVTEDRRVRADLEAARAASEAAARAKSRFLATMTHELRTPLNAVIGFADLLRKPQPAEDVAEYAGMIADAGRELLGLIDQILDVARSETAGLPVRAGRVDLPRLLSRVVAAKGCAAAAGRVALSLDLPPGLPEITADGARFEQVMQGLLSNALKFTAAGGSVRVCACLGAEGAVSVQVSDTGIGIAPEALPRVFEPFAQLDAERARRYAGSGIGLYLARSIAEAMGMRLTLSSKEGEGTVATLLIPPELACPPEEESA